MANELKVALVLSAIDNMSRQIDQATSASIRKLEAFQTKADAIGKSAFAFGGKAIGAGGAALAAVAFPVKQAADFETKMANVSTLIDTNVESMVDMQNQVLEISRRVPVGVADLATALYDVRSAGVDASQAMAVLESSSRLAVAGLSTTGEATNIMTSAVNAFKEEGLSSDQIANVLFQTVKAGKTTISELSQAFGANAGIIQSAGIKLVDFQAATAALTTVGTPAAQAQNQLRAAVVALQKPTSDMQKIFEELGVTTGEELIEQTGSLGAAFATVQSTAESLGVNIGKAFGSVEASAAVVSITGATNEAYTQTLANMVSGVNEVDEAFNKQNDTINNRYTRAMNGVSAATIQVGNTLKPFAADVIEKFTAIITKVGEFIAQNQDLVQRIGLAVAAFGTISVAVGTVSLVIGTVAKAFSMLASTGATVIRFAGLVVKGFQIMKIAMLANPITAIALGIAAAGVLIYTYWEPITEFFGNLAGVFYEAGANIVNSIAEGIMSGINAAGDAMQAVAEKVRAYLPFSPAKTGPLTDIDNVQLTQTVAKSMKPAPMVNAMQAATAATMAVVATASPMPGAALASPAPLAAPASAATTAQSGTTLVFNPTININGVAGDNVGEDIRAVLEQYKSEIMRMIEQSKRNKERARF